MELFLNFLKTFLIGGAICAVGQILVDKTKMTAGRILVIYVLVGVILGAVGLYQPFADWAGAGATVPLSGFGNVLASGVRDAVKEQGVLGAFSGGFTAAASGICAAVFFGYVIALVCKPRGKK